MQPGASTTTTIDLTAPAPGDRRSFDSDTTSEQRPGKRMAAGGISAAAAAAAAAAPLPDPSQGGDSSPNMSQSTILPTTEQEGIDKGTRVRPRAPSEEEYHERARDERQRTINAMRAEWNRILSLQSEQRTREMDALRAEQFRQVQVRESDIRALERQMRQDVVNEQYADVLQRRQTLNNVSEVLEDISAMADATVSSVAPPRRQSAKLVVPRAAPTAPSVAVRAAPAAPAVVAQNRQRAPVPAAAPVRPPSARLLALDTTGPNRKNLMDVAKKLTAKKNESPFKTK